MLDAVSNYSPFRTWRIPSPVTHRRGDASKTAPAECGVILDVSSPSPEAYSGSGLVRVCDCLYSSPQGTFTTTLISNSHSVTPRAETSAAALCHSQRTR